LPVKESGGHIFAQILLLGYWCVARVGTACKISGIGYIGDSHFPAFNPDVNLLNRTPIGVQQKLMRHSDIRTTMNIYGDAAKEELRETHS